MNWQKFRTPGKWRISRSAAYGRLVRKQIPAGRTTRRMRETLSRLIGDFMEATDLAGKTDLETSTDKEPL